MENTAFNLTGLGRAGNILSIFQEAIHTLEIKRVECEIPEPTLRVTWLKVREPKGTLKTIWLQTDQKPDEVEVL